MVGQKKQSVDVTLASELLLIHCENNLLIIIIIILKIKVRFSLGCVVGQILTLTSSAKAQ